MRKAPSALYQSARWRKIRKQQLNKQPICTYCYATGKITPATIADHITPHKGDPELFHNTSNIQSLCKYCHDSRKQMMDVYGYSTSTGKDGWPEDNNHPFLSGKPQTKHIKQFGIPTGITERPHTTTLICGPPGAGKADYANKHANNNLILNPTTTASRLNDNPYKRKQIAEAEVIALNAHDGPAFIIRELPDQRRRLAWKQALGKTGKIVILAKPTAKCIAKLKKENRYSLKMKARILAWHRTYNSPK